MSVQQSIAHYRVISKLGEGGMGAVYRATDTKLGHDVAIRVLPDSLAADPDRLFRFTREAQVPASLNHPNIAAIHGVEERALVMELVDGPTLAERIAAGAIPLDEALPIAKQMAEALEYAHEKGVIHRDLKPANIKITPEGRVKVLDFGLAKAISGDGAAADPMSSSTLTMRATQLGTILGTAAYMSPEQAKGKPVDKRADIWAFGVVLMEMLTGRQMYTGDTVSETLASVIKDTPDLSVLPAGLPTEIRRLLRRCLEKDPRRRLQAVGEARCILEEPAEEAAPTLASVAPPRRGVLPWIAGALALTTLTASWIAWRSAQPGPPSAPMRFSADLGPDAIHDLVLTGAISRDGRRIVFPVRTATGTRLATRLMDQTEATVLTGTENGRSPFFKPDGEWIGFFAGLKMKKISVQGGAALTVCDLDPSDVGGGDRGGSWAEDGTIVATLDSRHLFRVPEAGGKPLRVSLKTEEATNYRWPQVLPGGESVLVTMGQIGAFDDGNIAVLSLRTGDVKTVIRGGYFGRYLPSGYLIYFHQGTLFGIPFDARRLETGGTAVPVLDDVASTSDLGSGQLDFSQTGTLVYLSGKATAARRPVVWMDSTGKQTPAVPPSDLALTPRLSPDDQSLALSVSNDIAIFDVHRGALTPITFTHAQNRYPVWAPDSKHLVYSSTGPDGGIWWARADGSVQPQRILEAGGEYVFPESFSPDGRQLAFFKSHAGILILPLDTSEPDHPKPGKPELFQRMPENSFAAFSPDGQWLAYDSNETGPYQVWVQAYPRRSAGGRWQVSTVPARRPIWSRNRKELFFQTLDGHIMVAGYTANGEAFGPGIPRLWCDTPVLATGNFPTLDLAPDGKRFVAFPLGNPAGENKQNLHLTFVLNFFDELKRRMP